MTTASLAKQALIKFAQSEEQRVFALIGDWGVGKTHAWNNALKETALLAAPSIYSYVSLLGIQTLKELKLAILENAVATRTLDPTASQGLFERVRNKNNISHLRKLGSILPASVGKTVEGGSEWWGMNSLTDMMVCFDDIERNTDIKIDALMGLIAQLRDQNRCKVLLIFNNTRLDDDRRTLYEKYHEKVVDRQIVYSPTIDEAIEIAFPDPALATEISPHVRQLEMRNIRVLSKLRDWVTLLRAATPGRHPRVDAQLLQTTTAAIWCAYEPSPDKPTLEKLPHWTNGDDPFDEERPGDEDTQKMKAWQARIRDYGMTGIDEFDISIIRAIENGFTEGSDVTRHATELTKVHDAQGEKDLLGDAWNLLYGSLDDNLDEFVAAATKAITVAIKHIALSSVNRVVRTFRQLGKDSEADWLIEFFMERRSQDLPALSLSAFEAMESPLDGRLELKVRKALEALDPPITLQQAIANYAREKSWTKQDVDALQAASIGEIADYLRSTRGEEHVNIIRAFGTLRKSSDLKVHFDKFVAALRSFESAGRLNEYRVKRILQSFGVDSTGTTSA